MQGLAQPVTAPVPSGDGHQRLTLIDALDAGQASGMFRAEHLLHLRCEISDPDTPALTQVALERGTPRLVSIMDHTPGDRPSHS